MEAATVSVTLDVKVDPDWTEFCCKYSDMFSTDHIGYWARGMVRDRKNEENGWLLFEHGGEEFPDGEPNEAEAMRAWKAKEPLPPNYFRLDKAATEKAWAEGCKRYGVDWYENADANTYDVVVQMALLGEVRYG